MTRRTLFAPARSLWSVLPRSLRAWPPLRAIGTTLRRWLGDPRLAAPASVASMPPGAPAPAQALPPTAEGPIPPAGAEAPADAGPRLISSLEELDEAIASLDAAAAVSDDELRRGFARFHMQFPLALPADPDSPEYREVQMQLYAWLHGKPYAAANEVSSFDAERLAARPFPYSTGSPDTVGHQLIAVGHVVRCLGLREGQSLLEFGPGWGNTTLALAQMGVRVTAVDVEPNFVELLRRRAAGAGVSLEALQGDFSLAQTIDRRFDAVLFFECFHHCADHQSLVAALDRIVAPGGKVVFAAEPILDAFPLPWGLRLDGESLWAIRRNGWLELGFQETYFRGLLTRHGWRLDKRTCAQTPWGVVFVATREREETAA